MFPQYFLAFFLLSLPAFAEAPNPIAPLPLPPQPGLSLPAVGPVARGLPPPLPPISVPSSLPGAGLDTSRIQYVAGAEGVAVLRIGDTRKLVRPDSLLFLGGVAYKVRLIGDAVELWDSKNLAGVVELGAK